MCVWDGAFDQPFWEREALQLAQEKWKAEEPDEVDLAPGTEPPPGTAIPHERPLRTILDSRRAAERLWEQVKRRLHGPPRMITLRLALVVLLLALASQACGQESGPLTRARAEHRTPGMAGEVHCVDGQPVTESPIADLTGYARAENIKHEAMHGSQFSVGCDSIMTLWQTVPAYRLALEAEATCAGIKVYPDVLDRRFRKGQAAALLTRLYLPEFGFEDVYAALDIWCSS